MQNYYELTCILHAELTQLRAEGGFAKTSIKGFDYILAKKNVFDDHTDTSGRILYELSGKMGALKSHLRWTIQSAHEISRLCIRPCLLTNGYFLAIDFLGINGTRVVEPT